MIYKIYTDLNTLIKYYCDNTGATLVMRVNRETMDPKKPETVQMVLSQEVLYFQPSADITEWVLKGLNQQAGGTTQPASGGSGSAGRVDKAPIRK